MDPQLNLSFVFLFIFLVTLIFSALLTFPTNYLHHKAPCGAVYQSNQGYYFELYYYQKSGKTSLDRDIVEAPLWNPDCLASMILGAPDLPKNAIPNSMDTCLHTLVPQRHCQNGCVLLERIEYLENWFWLVTKIQMSCNQPIISAVRKTAGRHEKTEQTTDQKFHRSCQNCWISWLYLESPWKMHSNKYKYA